jgi:rhamnulokinase
MDYLAVDLGASSGRVIHGKIISNKLKLNEIHRFTNSFEIQGSFERWNIDYIFSQIIVGLKKAKKQGISKAFLGIDSWGVDYVLLDKNCEKLCDPIAYRDTRTNGAITKFSKYISKTELWQKTGIALQEYNTLFQLFVENKELIKKTNKILFIPNYLTYLLTGKMVSEKTIASTSGMLNIHIKDFDADLLELCKVKKTQFAPLVDSATILGNVLKIYKDIPELTVINVPCHDTASAYVGTYKSNKKNENFAYLSSGTWSLLGTIASAPDLSNKTFNNGFTNEWGVKNTYRILKNIMGLWMLNNIQKELPKKYAFSEFAELTRKVEPFLQKIDINDKRFLNPKNMIEEIQSYCKETDQIIPKTSGELAMAIYSNLADFYAKEIKNIGNITHLNIVGGGSNVHILNELTAKQSGIPVFAGPVEATAIGNIETQMVYSGELKSFADAKKLTAKSFKIKSY